MTHNQIEYQNYKENVRHNKSAEEETNRHNVAGEVETKRHNIANETETNRHNVVVESQGWETVRETQRHNIQSEQIGMMQASAAQTQAAAAYKNANTNAYAAQKNAEYQSGMLAINKQNAYSNTMNAYTNRSNADTQAKYTTHMAAQGWVNSAAKMVDAFIPF